MDEATQDKLIAGSEEVVVEAEFIENKNVFEKAPTQPQKNTDVPTQPEDEEEAKEDKTERYKMILIDLGFRKTENSDDTKEQYIKKDGDITIGRTFTEAQPVGKFWALEGNSFVETADVKKLDIVQAFYEIRDGKKPIEDVKKDTGLILGAKVAPPQNRPQIKREIGAMKLVKKGGYYQAGGHKEPDAWLVQQWGNEAGVSSKLISIEQGDIQVKAIVRAEMGDQFVEAAVIHHFATTREVIALEIIESMERNHKRPIEGYSEDGRPLLSQETNYRIYKRFLRFKNFAARDAVTKAGRIATLKILNCDWREPEEIEAEIAEVRSVNNG